MKSNKAAARELIAQAQEKIELLINSTADGHADPTVRIEVLQLDKLLPKIIKLLAFEGLPEDIRKALYRVQESIESIKRQSE